MTFKKLMGIAFLGMFALSTMTMTSCSKKKGCTYEKSDNYDADAEEDDGSCKAWSEKFVGEYTVQLGCQHPVLAQALNNEFTMTVSSTADDQTSMILETGIGTIPLSGVINKKTMTFNELKIDTFSNDAGLVMYNVVINGSADYQDNGDLTGSINVSTSFINATGGSADDTCPLTATRK